ncbi:erythrocyte membrane protein 1, PfEMP1, putative [Plasmodium sp. gorilla clade G1]|nr:erythrocyte membrane protein 1, PfEMP1, putative [Plasmodium sp. gorilla clade G1]
MVRKAAAPVPASELNYDDVKDARELLDKIGEKVYNEKVKVDSASKVFRDELKGNLQQAKGSGGKTSSSDDPCNFDYDKLAGGDASGKRYPCKKNGTGKDVDRFSNTHSGQCTNKKIEGNKYNTKTRKDCGACAPFRRLHLCNKNLETIDTTSMTKHDLLAELCYVAKYEGESIKKYHDKHKKINESSQLCTVLARSFADIGDIVRGKDLFYGNPQEKDQRKKLDKNLQKIFGNIYNELTSMNGEKSAKEHYQDGTENYYKLREDWWTANRETVWKAMTCSATEQDHYFKPSEKKIQYFSNKYCGRNEQGKVPTNLDYVPQFLRWFDEWADDFCRLKKIKLELAKRACHDYPAKLYCSHNGFDCTKYNPIKDDSSRDPICTRCSNKCVHYEFWLRNQRKEFEKQKTKYTNEIGKHISSTDISNSNINNKYYNEFYEELKKKYGTVENFLTLLNKGRYCQKKNAEKEVIDFTKNGEKDAFYRSDYCQPCPDCVVHCDDTTCSENQYHMYCKSPRIYKRPPNVTPTNINVLFSGDNQEDIADKLSSFCNKTNSENGENNEKWECYYTDEYNNNCRMNSPRHKDQKHHEVMPFYEFFDFWVTHLIKDTIKWESDLKNCINHTNVTDCGNGCNKNCKCFDHWVEEKQKEWKNVKTVLGNESSNLHKYYSKLNGIFDSFFFHVTHKPKEEKEIEEEAKEAQEEEGKWNQLTAKLKEIIESQKSNTHTGKSQDAIKPLLEYIKESAKTCIDNNSNESCDHSKDSKTNPCYKSPGSKPTKTMKHIAELKQQDAREQLEEGGVGETKLKGDASKGKYDRKGSPDGFKNVCSITDIHSNRTEGFSSGPCYGKDDKQGRFKIGTVWKHGNDVNTKYPEVYMPPRREHMCTSNLEYLQTCDGALHQRNGKLVNNSFLGDVLLSAKMDAEEIIKRYKGQNQINDPIKQKHQESICRALRYSFADIADIIRGRDMWDYGDNKTKIQVNLKDVFEKIKEYHPGIQGNKKYNDDDKNTPPYKLLREDWWEANRHQVWRAMKCATQNIENMKCKGIPIEDYIPQRLRWMTEWAEWYCKKQSQEYDKLEEECEGCMGNDKGEKCTERREEYKKCNGASKKYEDKIKPWKEQWEKMEQLYELLYQEARVNVAGNGGIDTSNTIDDEEDKPVIEFLFELYKENGGTIGPFPDTKSKRNKRATTDTNTPYNNAGAYVHDTGVLNDCKEQTYFCRRNDSDKYYAFKNRPHKYEEVLRSKIRNMLKALGDATIDDDPSLPSLPSQSPPDEDDSDEEDSEEEDEEEIRNNPCGGDNTDGKIASVKQIAKQMHDRAKQQMKENIKSSSDKNGKNNVLKADASKGTYKRGGSGDNFKEGKLCTITKNDSNDTRPKSTGPCYGKDGSNNGVRMRIGKDWTHLQKEKTTYSDVYLPPRREHMCTSNLENLDVSWVTKDGNAIHSLLGDVQLSAKMDAQEIIKRYKTQNKITDPIPQKDQEAMCRAVRYSFADLGDIIRGRDMWDLDNGSKDMEKHLIAIFKNIKENLDGIKDNPKYTDDDRKTPAYKQLREDWWEANRRQVWKAMKCHIKELKDTSSQQTSSDHCGYSRRVPHDDYIPQRLRWMNEWAEWYCKMQSQEYDNLENKCTVCRKKSANCVQGDDDCKTCKDTCTEYNRKIKTWEKQWEKIKEKYEKLYEKAKEYSDSNHKDTPDKDEYVVKFLYKLQKENNEKSTYSTSEGYVHQEATMNCNTQKQFCKNRNGVKKSNAAEDDNYTFKQPPPDYATSCACQNRKPPEPCEIVANVFKDEDKFTEACSTKYKNGKEKYTQWRCINDSSNTTRSSPPPHAAPSTSSASPGQHSLPANSANSVTSATCIPPRRQQMYVEPLQQVDGNTSQVELRKVFIETAAIETFFQWHKFKMERKKPQKKKDESALGGALTLFPELDEEEDIVIERDPEDELKTGSIPEEFKRQMFYTFADYRDLCVGKHIAKDTTGISNTVMSILSGKSPDMWWNENAEAIWEGMLCVLCYNTKDKKEIQGVRDKLIGYPKNPIYNYNTVTISTGISLYEFASRPTFFRWLEEWGEEFCKKRTDKLKKLDKECRGVNSSNNKKYCSGDGYHCTDKDRKHNKMFTRLNCPECEKECTNYRKWIQKKVQEFDKQKSKYYNEHKKLEDNVSNNHDRNFYEDIIKTKDYSSAPKFLASLNNCKNPKDNSDGKNKIDFNHPENTFSPSTYCTACPLSGVNCDGKDGCITNRDNNLMHPEGESTYFDILINDGTTNDTDNKLQEKCKEYELYRNLKNQKWKCQHMNKNYKCQRENPLNSEYYDDKIPFKILFERWLRDFVQGYNKSKERITRCTNDETSCKQGCKGNCDCVEEWLKVKEEEWGKIKNYYKEYFEEDVEPIDSNIKGFFEHGTFSSDAEEAKNVVHDEKKRDELWGCTGRNDCQLKKGREKYGDFITNLTKNLREKIKTCQTKHDEQTKAPCVEPPHSDENHEDPDTPTTENTKPPFCPQEEVVPEEPKVPESGRDSTKTSESTKKDESPIEDIFKTCPYNNDTCNKYGNKKNIGCLRKQYHADLNNWTNALIKYDKGKSTDMNHAIFVPPRRRQLCFRNIRRFYRKIYSEDTFTEYFLADAYNEAKQLSGYYGKDNEKILEAIKNSFADYANIIKGDDMLDDGLSEIIQKILDKLNEKKTLLENLTLHKLWEKKKNYVWYVMLCGYKDAGGVIKDTDCSLPKEEGTHQFLRWLLEWGKVVCKEKKKRKESLEKQCECSGSNEKSGYQIINSDSCKNELEEYIRWNRIIKKSLDLLNIKYEKVIETLKDSAEPSELTVEQYIETGIKIGECNLFDIHEIHDIYTNKEINSHEEILKRLCPDLDFTYDTTENTETSEDTYTEEDTEKNKPATPAVKPSPKPEVPPHPPPPVNPPPPADEPFDPTILQTTIPFGIALALGSIAFLFLKKKTQAPVDLFSVLNIPKGDYDIPTLKSSNRYIPYASDRHKGKTYIYMEGDSSGDEKYAFMSDTTDITSSESEYEELDINDIYVPSSPKYKTLIEVVLEPSKRDIPNNDTPMNKFTDDEWNQLKHDFISNMLQSQPNDVPNDYKSGNIPLNTQPNTLYFNKPEEKPFITSIHDRNLYSGEEHSYNINMVNNDNIPMSGNNNVYSGIDLINDSLNSNKVDIYDELLKRKENELFGTNHPKHTNTHSVTKSSNSDPIDNQLDLFHTWLDRHRDMCEQWNNKEEVLDKLKEEWNKDNNSGDIHTSDSNKTLNTDVSIQIHMDNPKPINQFTNMDTILEDLDKYNEPYYDVQDDIYYDVNDHDASTVDSNNMDVPSKVQIEMDVNSKLVKEKYPISDVWDI